MSQSNDSKTDKASLDGAHRPEPSTPEFRFVQMEKQQAVANPEIVSSVINKRDYMANATSSSNNAPPSATGSSKPALWSPQELRTVPAFYPLEKSSRLVEDDSASNIAARLSDCLRCLSIQAVYDNDTAYLFSAENVEMHLSLWKTSPMSPQQGIVVELQRRSGDSITFHRYATSILDAAMGLVDSTFTGDDVVYSKKLQRLLSLNNNDDVDDKEHETAIQAIEIAHGLLMKDRMDARVLGLESLCLLTDPRKTGLVTAVLTAHVVLLGSTQGVEIPGVDPNTTTTGDEAPFQEIRQGILSLVQFSRIGELEDLTDEDEVGDKEHLTLLHNLALAVLANALDCIENPDRYEPEDTKPRARLRTASSNDVANEFLSQTEAVSKKEMLSTLISELGRASEKPHNAVLSAKCIGSLCRASDEAKKRAKELGAKQVVSTALDVGVRTHARLEQTCKTVVKALERSDEEEEDNGGNA